MIEDIENLLEEINHNLEVSFSILVAQTVQIAFRNGGVIKREMLDKIIFIDHSESNEELFDDCCYVISEIWIRSS